MHKYNHVYLNYLCDDELAAMIADANKKRRPLPVPGMSADNTVGIAQIKLIACLTALLETKEDITMARKLFET